MSKGMFGGVAVGLLVIGLLAFLAADMTVSYPPLDSSKLIARGIMVDVSEDHLDAYDLSANRLSYSEVELNMSSMPPDVWAHSVHINCNDLGTQEVKIRRTGASSGVYTFVVIQDNRDQCLGEGP